MCKEGWQRGGRGQKNISNYHLAKINGIKGELRLVREMSLLCKDWLSSGAGHPAS